MLHSHMMMLEARSGQWECEIRLVEARLFYTVAIHIFCSHAECGHTVKQQNVSVHMENVPALLYSFFGHVYL